MEKIKNKNIISRLAAITFAAIAFTLVLALNIMSIKANAASDIAITENLSENNSSANAADTYAESFNSAFIVNSIEAAPDSDVNEGLKLVPLAAGGAAGGGAAGGGSSSSADSTYKTVINFFITWLRRIGAVVALIGAIMFGLAIKSNDAEQKQAGLITMIAGFVVAAICQAADMFDLFS